jgi:hypothetical protein
VIGVISAGAIAARIEELATDAIDHGYTTNWGGCWPD